MRTGVATIPLDYGRCPYWLFDRMKKLSRGITLAIIEEFGPEEFQRRLSDPVWFQSFGCVIGFDWNSSGLTTTVMGALKEGLRGLERGSNLFICGGKGKTSRKTPEQIQNWGEFLNWPPEKIDQLVYASKISAKIDSACVQDTQNPFPIYHHNFIFTNSEKWTIIQQGMNINLQKARRYHWLSSNLRRVQGGFDFIEEPHSGVVSDIKLKPLNLTAKESDDNRQISLAQVKEEPKTFLKNINFLQTRNGIIRQSPNYSVSIGGREALPGFTEVGLENTEFHWHPVLKEKFDLKRLEKTIFAVGEQNPESFEGLLSLKGVGPKTIRALSLVSEIIYGARPSYEDPARYSFSVGGKDGTPYPVDREIYDQTLEIMEKGIKKSKINLSEKQKAFKRLAKIAS